MRARLPFPRPNMLRLLIDGQNIPLEPGTYVVGRASDCDIVVQSASMSRYHARLWVKRRRVMVEDLSSRNGVWVGLRRIAESTELGIDDCATFGTTRAYLISDEGPPTARYYAEQKPTLEMAVPILEERSASEVEETTLGDAGPLSEQENRVLALLVAASRGPGAAPDPFGADEVPADAELSNLDPITAIRTLVGHLELAGDAGQGPDRRMADLGAVAADMAHDLTQPLNAISVIVQGRMRELAAEDEAGEEREDFAEMLALVRRMATIIDEVRAYARPSRPVKLESVDLDEELGGAISSLRRELNAAGIELAVDLRARARVRAATDSLQRVFVNLLQNARDALCGGDRPARRIEVTSHLDGDTTALVTVRDNAGGVPEELRARVFEPFVTTKADEQGLGLGLSITQRIVSALGGSVGLEVEPGIGSTFWVRLPVAS